MITKATIAAVSGLAMAGSAVGNLIENQHVAISTTCVVGSIVLPALWLAAKGYQRIIDRLESIESRMHDLPCQDKNRGWDERERERDERERDRDRRERDRDAHPQHSKCRAK